MSLEAREAYRKAGVGVLAVKLEVRVLQLSIGFEHQWGSGPMLEPLEKLSAKDAAFSESGRMRVEDYVTSHLGGVAGELLYVLANRCHLRCSQGEEVIHWKFWRRTWECSDPEVDRAFAIAFAYLRNHDQGDAEASLWRLWHRAVELLRQIPQREQLDRLAKRLLEAGKLSGDQVARILRA